MIEIYENIFIGNENDCYGILNKSQWAILHCCKHPFHCQFVGYKGSLSPNHPEYALKRIGNEMALNLVDMNSFSVNYLEFNKKMFETAFSFLDEYKEQGYKLLIHCNQGESRAPTLGMLYAARFGAFGYAHFATSVRELQKIYPQYNPKIKIYKTVEALWQYFVR